MAINYYEKIKEELIDNEINKKVKDYSKNKYELQKYYNVGKLLFEAGNKYGDGIIRDFSTRLIKELSKKYSVRYLFDIRKLYLFSKVHPLDAQLTLSHYRLLFPIKNDDKINYYIQQVVNKHLSKRELLKAISLNEYERLPKGAKEKLNIDDKTDIIDFVKNPILIKSNSKIEHMSEKILQKLILDDISSFLEELGDGFTFIKNEYPIKLGGNYNYIDFLLFNYKYNCFVVIELKVIELKKEHVGQIQVYMNYIDENLKGINQEKTIGIIVCKEDNKYVIKYCSDSRIIFRVYELV